MLWGFRTLANWAFDAGAPSLGSVRSFLGSLASETSGARRMRWAPFLLAVLALVAVSEGAASAWGCWDILGYWTEMVVFSSGFTFCYTVTVWAYYSQCGPEPAYAVMVLEPC